jgi:predicted negative regulator of RcsB-dependent stress response
VKGLVLARLVMWGFIIGMVWYFSQQYRQSSPTPEQEQSMREAARLYSEHVRGTDQKTEGPAPTPIVK